MNFSSVRRSFFVAVPVRFGTKLFVLFFGWPPQATPGSPSPLCPAATAASPLLSNLPRTPHTKCDSFFVSFRFRFGFRFGLVWFRLWLCFIYVDYLMDFAPLWIWH